MIGRIFRHDHLGIGKILDVQGNRLRIRYIENGQEFTMGPSALQEGILSRKPLAPTTRCVALGEHCIVKRALPTGDGAADYEYEVEYADGRSAILTEVDLEPLPGQVIADPILQLQALEPERYAIFNAREWMVKSYSQLIRDGAGFQALLSSRIDLYPHQAFVAGKVIQDVRRRFILADEVGLGKTIEAGIVIHDLLQQKPNARILVLCPGALTQQWLCELYSKFGGHVFKLLDLHPVASIRAAGLGRAIVSMTLATFRLADVLAEVEWDLVVIDEVHNLLTAPALYGFADRLSRAAESLLLLSAVPAQRREDEYLRLLHLLEPRRYVDLGAEAQAEFRDLYAAQEDVGRRLRRLTRAADDFAAGEQERGDVERLVERLVRLPALSADAHLQETVALLPEEGDRFIAEVRSLVDYVATYFRINRRILKNRREQLIEADRLKPVERRFVPLSYVPEQLELEAAEGVAELVREARDAGIPMEVLAPFARVLHESMVSAARLNEILEQLEGCFVAEASAREVAYVAAGHLTGYAEWPEYVDALCRVTRPYLSGYQVRRAHRRASAWFESSRGHVRRERLLEFLRERSRDEARPKLLIFVGQPGASVEVADAIRQEFGEDTLREFRFDLPREQKEENVQQFQWDSNVWILVSDETAGEGRNFQFVDEVVHVDTPWNVAKIEQRIGRLDRLGRAAVRPDAISNVVFAEGSVEAALIDCFSEGVGVYHRSISGLEFALREVEQAVIDRVSADGAEGLRAYIPEASQLLEQERARDASEALFDQASFNQAAAQRLQRVAQSGATEKQLQHSFVRYLRTISTRASVHERNDVHHPGAIWRIAPEDFRRGVLPADSQERPELFRDHIGTFRRKVAQQRLDVEFFTVGNPFFDTIVQSLWDGAVGRTYAVMCELHGQHPWVGLEFAFRVEPDWDAVRGRPGLVNQASMFFSPRPLNVFIDCEGLIDDGSAGLLQTRFSLRMSDRGEKWVDLSPEDMRVLTRDQWGDDWQAAVQSLYDSAREHAQQQFALRLDNTIRQEDERIRELIRQAKLRGDEDGEVQALQALKAALEGWTIRLDSAGFLAVNPPRS